MKKILALIIVLLIAAIGFCSHVITNLRSEVSRLEDNQTTLLSKVDFYRTESGRHATSAGILRLEKDEAERSCRELTDIIDDLNIKLKRVELAAQLRAESEVKIKTVVRDSIVYVDSSAHRVPAFHWADAWTDIAGYLHADSAYLNYRSTDTIVPVVHRVPKRWWFFRWGTKELRMEITNTNPHVRVSCPRVVQIE